MSEKKKETIVTTRNSEVYAGLSKVYKTLEYDRKQSGLSVALISEIIGAPPQFNDNADPRIIKISSNKENYGRQYYKSFVKNAPLVFFEPGVPKFMPVGKGKWSFFNKKDEEIYNSVYSALINATADDSDNAAASALEALQKNGEFRYDSRYYLFKSAFQEYSSYVNSMARIVSSSMGITDFSKIRKTYPLMSSSPYARRSIGFYYDKDGTSYSESGSTSTGDSLIANIGSSASEMKRELNFILNADVADADVTSSMQSTFTERVSAQFPNGITSFLGKMSSYTSTVFKGGNLLFPEVWKDSQFSKSVTLSFKLTSPYGDPVSIFNNIYFPILSLLAMALPRQISTQGYTSPFLVHCYSKGWFNIEMGMIESISIEKGTGDNWSKDGFPLEATVSVTIKDLYNELMLCTGSHSFFLAKNTGLTEYLTTMAGVSPISEDPFKLDNKFSNMAQSLKDGLNSLLNGLNTSDLAINLNIAEEWASSFTGTVSDMLDGFFKPDAPQQDYEEVPSGTTFVTNTSNEKPKQDIEKSKSLEKRPPKKPKVNPLSLKNKN